MLIRLVLPIWSTTAWTGLAERDTAERQRFLDYRALDAGLHHADTLVEGLRKMRNRTSVLPLWRHHNPMPMVHDRIFESGMAADDVAALHRDVERIDALEQYFTAWTIKTQGAAGAWGGGGWPDRWLPSFQDPLPHAILRGVHVGGRRATAPHGVKPCRMGCRALSG